KGDIILEIPDKFIITTNTVKSHHILGPIISRIISDLSPLEILCIFLIYERSLGDESFWSPYLGYYFIYQKKKSNPFFRYNVYLKPYLDSVPKEYTTTDYFDEEEIIQLQFPHLIS